jgi:hypothetical protein
VTTHARFKAKTGAKRYGRSSQRVFSCTPASSVDQIGCIWSIEKALNRGYGVARRGMLITAKPVETLVRHLWPYARARRRIPQTKATNMHLVCTLFRPTSSFNSYAPAIARCRPKTLVFKVTMTCQTNDSPRGCVCAFRAKQSFVCCNTTTTRRTAHVPNPQMHHRPQTVNERSRFETYPKGYGGGLRTPQGYNISDFARTYAFAQLKLLAPTVAGTVGRPRDRSHTGDPSRI